MTEFAQAVTPDRYKLFQLADMIATLKLVETKLAHGDPMTESEYKFFGGPRNFTSSATTSASSRRRRSDPAALVILLVLPVLRVLPNPPNQPPLR